MAITTTTNAVDRHEKARTLDARRPDVVQRSSAVRSRSAAALVAAIMAHGAAVHAQSPAGDTSRPAATSATNAPTHLPTVTVTGRQNSYKSDQVSLPKLTEPLHETPQSITVVPRQLMDDQGTATLRDALRNVAGISLAAGEGSTQGDNLTLRGFTARNDIYLDGMRDFGSYYRDPFNLQEVEVLEGPAGVLFGRGSTGGVISQESKAPMLTPFVAGSTSFGTDLTRRGTLDINTPLPEWSTNDAFRLNLMANDSGVADRDVTENRRFGIAPSLALGLGTASRAEFSFFHQQEDDIPDYGIPWLQNGAAPVARDNFYGFRDDYLRTYVNVGTVKAEHDFSDAFTLRDQVRYANYARDFRITEPDITNSLPIPPLPGVMVERNEIGGHSHETMLWDQLDAKAQFDTGPISHTLIAGAEGGRETSDPTRYNYTGVPGTSLLTPDEEQDYSGEQTPRTQVVTTAYTAGVYAIDTLKLGEHWDLSGGVRWDYFNASYAESVAPALSFDQVVEKPTWRGALVWKPQPNGSVYFDYGTSFDPSAEQLSLTTATANTAPEENETFEFGTKWNLLRERLTVSGAIFRTDKTNAREPSPTDPTVDVVAGKERVDGLELQAIGQVLPGWQVFASYAYLKSELLSSQYYTENLGLPLGNVPKNTFNIWSSWQLPWHLETGLGLNLESSRTASITAPYAANGLLKEVPGYWTMEAMLKYTFSRHANLQLNAYNLANRYYDDQLHPAHIVPGARRSLLLTFHFKF
jgi:catecholate siderophore receptor